MSQHSQSLYALLCMHIPGEEREVCVRDEHSALDTRSYGTSYACVPCAAHWEPWLRSPST